ncbi:MAG: 6,7-dimethyl-8-ribityllumazine synthase [Bacteroidetes bacterium]|nr:MAG: 6,7-dimethyl-8-ribityllumazine synthase [Bacteroidota bacterium]
MGQVYSGVLNGSALKMGIVASRWNEFMVGKLVEGAVDALVRHGVDDDQIDIAYVPGSFELPLGAKKMVESGRYQAVICLGVVIRGATPHFDYVAGEASKGIAQVGLQSGIPVSFGVLTCDTIEQAIERSGSKGGNKGFEAAVTAIEMVNLISAIEAG